ncbi:hypothetical protein HWV62_4663 [Athelia sp. TMB]|nr:hypothetical protein HWV62_4663 [Athelia sp. TMB]
MSSSPFSIYPIVDCIPPDHVNFILINREDSPFYLQIPLAIINALVLQPRKYLNFLGWCILGVKGGLRHNGAIITASGALDSGETYYFEADGDEATDFRHAIDLEVIQERSSVPSGETGGDKTFRSDLLERDQYCVWTGASLGAGTHIIPHARSSEWFQSIIANRPSYGEDIAGLTDINDIRNGFFSNPNARALFDCRNVAILKTPNEILDTTDVRKRHPRPSMPPTVSFPSGRRYTMQWLAPPDPYLQSVPNNCDAAFGTAAGKGMPSDLLLHYNYGAAAVLRWGRGLETLWLCSASRRPTISPPPKTGAGAGAGEAEDADARWDADDVVLFLWGNTKAARQRRAKEEEEDAQRLEQWRAGVS